MIKKNSDCFLWGGVTAFLLVAVLNLGCSITFKDANEIGFRFGTEVAAFHRTSTTSSEANAKLEVDDFVKERFKADEQSENIPD